MPELPEVELVARVLNREVAGRHITAAELRRSRLAPHAPEDFASSLTGRTINSVGRRGKYILFHLSGGTTLLVHLRMSGRFSVLTADSPDPKFAHAVFHLADGERLVFDDQRHFGFMRVAATPDLGVVKELSCLAPEPFSDDFSVEYLYRAARRTKRSLKEFLLDQTRVCGLGNIYACEAMFAAGLSPRRAPTRLSRARAAQLHASIREILEAAISFGVGQSVDPADLEGGYYNGDADRGWCVYDREGDACTRCSAPIARIRQAGRSTYFCRHCQRG